MDKNLVKINTNDIEGKRVKKGKKSKKSKKNRKSDPIVNDISTLLSSNLSLVSPNGSFNTEKNTSSDSLKNGINNHKKSSKSLTRNVSSSSLDNFVVRTPKNPHELKQDDQIKSDELNEGDSKINQDLVKEIESDDDFEIKESRFKEKIKNNKKLKAIGNDISEELITNNETTFTSQEKKNAFQFMMDSRNKVIGSNSPGKDLKNKENLVRDKEKLSARKNLLQNWADKLGGVKRRVEEVEKDEIIAYKMEKRAKRLKKLLNVPTNQENSIINLNVNNQKSPEAFENSNFQEINQNKSKNKNLDKYFSIKSPNKSEIMNETESIQVYDSDKNEPEEEVLKIKMFSPQVFKRKRNSRLDKNNSKLSENNSKLSENNLKLSENNSNSFQNDSKSSQNNSRSSKNNSKLSENNSKLSQNNSNELKNPSTPTKPKNSRSERIKKSQILSYSENSDSNDSDTFPLRRSTRKRTIRKFDSVFDSEDSNDIVIDVDLEEKKKLKKPSKVAPVFLLSTPKPKLDPEALEARKKFLNSGIPESLKKAIEKEKMYELDFDIFPKISHIQQKTPYNTNMDFWNLPNPKINLKTTPSSPIKIKNKLKKGSITNLTEPKIEINLNLTTEKTISNFKEILQKIKEDNPDYPVYKSFRILNEKSKTFNRKPNKKKGRRSKDLNKIKDLNKNNDINTEQSSSKENGSLNQEMWTEKYKPTTHEEILGNNKKVIELKKWLESWNEYINDVNRNKSDCEFDDSSCNNIMGLSNAIILTGPFGSGKTMSVYALCNELGINIIELNASSKRTGKRLLQEIQEATQSHQVKNDPFKTYLNKQNVVKSSNSNKKLCLILIEDLDIIFDQDEGFLNALNQLLLTTKRPIVITTTDINSNNLQKFDQYPIIKFSGFSSKVLGVWLQILCLLEGVFINLEEIEKLFDFFKGDVRRTLIQMQFLIQSGGSLFKNIDTINFKPENKKDLNDYVWNESFSNDNNKILIHKDFIYNFLDKNCLVYDFNLEKIWWNLSIILDEKCNNIKNCKDLNEILSFIDNFYTKSNIVENHNNSIENLSYLKDNIELRENFNLYKNNELIRDISNSLLKNSISFYNERKLEFDKPTLGQKRWLKKHKDCSETFSQLAPFTYHTDKRSYALDYYPTLRAISRSETHRASVNVKRKNRFYNYLRALDFTCSDSTNETACNIFSIKSDLED